MKNAFFSILLLLPSLTVYSLDKGVGINPNNKDSLWNTSLPYAIARQGLRAASGDEYIVAFQDFDTYVFGLSNSSRVIKVNKDGRSLLGNWPLTTPYSCDDGSDDCKYNWWVGRWSDQEFLEPELKNLFKHHSGGEIQVMPDGLGCLNKTPLRYGDIDGDTKNELVIFLNDNLLIFSPEKQKTIFLIVSKIANAHIPTKCSTQSCPQ